MIAANRSLLATLVATNVLGQNTPAIAATEAHYEEMWAQDAAAMYGYAGMSAAATTTVTPFTMPPQNTDPTGLTNQAAAVAQAAGTSAGTHAETVMSAGPQLISATPQALQTLTEPATGSSSSSTSPLSSMSSLSMLTMPARMATMPMSMLMRMFMMGGMGSTNTAAKAAATGATTMGSVLSSGLGSSTRALGSISLAGLGGGGSAVSAGMGRAASIGALSVPSGWAGVAPAVSPTAATAFPASIAGAVPAVQASAQTGVPPMMPIANMAGRGAVGDATSRFELRPSVIPRSPAGG